MASLSQEKWGTHDPRSNDHDWEESQDTERFLIYHSKSMLLNDSTMSTFFGPRQAVHSFSPNIEIMFVLFDTEAWRNSYSSPADTHAHTYTNSPAWLGLGKHTNGIRATDQEGY